MSSEPACCMSLSSWMVVFDGWINTLETNDLLLSKIFFDFRSAMGEGQLVPALQAHLKQSVLQQPRFMPMLAQSILQYEPPMSSFKTIVVKNTQDGRKGFDIKGVIAQIVDISRLKSLQSGVEKTGTVDRLEALMAEGHFSRAAATDTMESFRTLLDIRLLHQARRHSNRLNVDNIIDPDDLDPEQRKKLKLAFVQIKALQESLQYEFGTPR